MSEVLKKGSVLCLYANGVERDFIILDDTTAKKGGSAICYDAMYRDQDLTRRYGKLKKFYLQDESLDFREEARKYISAYKRLLEHIARHDDGEEFFTFVPQYEIYYDQDECPYIWTVSIPMLTFQEIADRLLTNRDSVEENLYEIVKTIRSLTECIKILHTEELIHGDITPSNFGFYVRNDRVLSEGLSLFDLNTLRYIGQKPRWFTNIYYDNTEEEIASGNRADIRAIGITLSKAFFCSNESVEELLQINNMTEGSFFRKAQDIVFSGDLFRHKGIPEDPRVQKQIVKILLETVTRSPERRISSCSELITDLEVLETYLQPYIKRVGLGRGLGLEIVNRAAERKERVKSLYRYVLYERPLYLTQNAADRYRIAIVGFGEDSQSFLDVCLEISQSMNVPVEVCVLDDYFMERTRKVYLDARPALPEFFEISGYEEKLTGAPYGKISFTGVPGHISPEAVKKWLEAGPDFHYIFIAAGNDQENELIAEKTALSVDGKTTSINCLCERPVISEKGDIHHIYINDDYSKFSCAQEIVRMAFNAHLVWSGTLNTYLDQKEKEFRNDYYFKSSISVTMAIKYRLHYAGVDLSQQGPYKAAEAIKPCLTRNTPQKLSMIASEQRRWVTEKLCEGWIPMSAKECAPYYSTNDLSTKRHVCLVRSSETLGLQQSDFQEHQIWDNIREEQLSKLDELDRMSVELHNEFRKNALSFENSRMFGEDIYKSILDELKPSGESYAAFEEWYDNLVGIFNDRLILADDSKDFEGTISYYEYQYNNLRMLVSDDMHFSVSQKKSVIDKIDTIYNSFIPITLGLKYHDYKKNNAELIEAIPFILTYRKDICMVVPVDYSLLAKSWSPKNNKQPFMNVTELFSCVAAATIINPSKLYLVYDVPAEESPVTSEQAENIEAKKDAMVQYLKRKGLQTEIIFEKNTGVKDFLLRIHQEMPDQWILIESKKIIQNNKGRNMGTYSFDMNEQVFTTSENLAWLGYIDRKGYITARDVASFLGRTAIIPKQPYLRKNDAMALFETYNSKQDSWKKICHLLASNKYRALTTLRMNREYDKESVKVYHLPFGCYESAAQIVSDLIRKQYIDPASKVERYMVDECKVTIVGYTGEADDLDRLFRQSELLLAERKFRIERSEVQCDALRITDIRFSFQDKTTGLQDKKAESEVMDILEDLKRDGHVVYNIKQDLKGTLLDISYGSHNIKEMFMKEGNFLEMYTCMRARNNNSFNDALMGVKIHKTGEPRSEKELDCFVTKGFRTVIIECKSVNLDNEIKARESLTKYKNELSLKVKRYGINGIGILAINSDAEFRDIPDPDNIITVSDTMDIVMIEKSIEAVSKRESVKGKKQ